MATFPTLPLEGIFVVSLEQAIAAPLATRHLADLGARVIKIERPGEGDFARGYDQRTRGLSSHFVWTNRSKESVTLNLKHPEAKEILLRLMEKADVFVENLAPGAAARLGLSAEVLRPRFPRLIVCDISGYGATGPYGPKKAYDLLIQAEAGFLSVTGTETERVKAGIPVADISAGMYSLSNILAALLRREKTGEGCHIDISLLESLCEWMGYPLYYSFEGAPPPERSGAFHSSVFPYGPFLAGDGQEVFFGLQNEREWSAFCRAVLEQPELANDERFSSNFRRSANRAVLTTIIHEAFSTLTAAQVVDRLERANIANARMNQMPEVWNHPQLRARDRWREIPTPAGPIPALLPPGRVDTYEPRMAATPALGENTDAVLKELGYSEAEIVRLHDAGAV
ncbi:MAG TPA: CaiB/BaiF CoA-transferase family protein [Bryobacteraceae bacterium]|nr:CaiB/BaiF CoA-transferase family protein [Bryobacteraceae bacterium]